MTKTKSTKRALLMSALALLMCVSMLIGSTFAWFTDSVTSGVNTIQSGTLKVDLENAAGDSIVGKSLSFVKAEDAPDDEAILWEPGCTYELTPVYVHNEGTLALKYKVVINGLDGDAKLLEAIEWSVKVGGTEMDLADFEEVLNAGARSEKAIVLVGHMKEEANNDYQGLTAEGISITVYATQATVEFDSFDNQYDEDAEYPAVVTNAAELVDALAAGKNVVLADDVKMENEALAVTADQDVIIDLGGNTLTTVNNEAKASAAINNKGTLTLKNGTVTYEGVGDPSNGYGTNTINNTGKLVIDGATIINTTDSGSSVAIDCSAGAELIVNSGVIESQKNAIRLCPFADGAINCTINDGTITGARAIQIQLPSNKPAEAPEINLTVNGGTLSALDTVNGFVVYSFSSGQSFDNVNVAINGGTFDGYVAFGGGSAADDEHVTITGGTFNNGVWRLDGSNWELIPTP